MIRAKLSAGGIVESGPCVYVLSLDDGKTRKTYIGRTGTSNNTGISPPFKRLAGHLSRRGKTQSCIHDNNFPDGFLERACICFTAAIVPSGFQHKAEKWLRWKLREEKDILNRDLPPTVEPDIPPEVKRSLNELYREIQKN